MPSEQRVILYNIERIQIDHSLCMALRSYLLPAGVKSLSDEEEIAFRGMFDGHSVHKVRQQVGGYIYLDKYPSIPLPEVLVRTWINLAEKETPKEKQVHSDLRLIRLPKADVSNH